MSRACRQRCRLEIGHEFDMRFTSKAARFGSLVPPATSPLPASMPSTDGHRRMHVLSVEPAAHVPACSALCGVIGKQIGKHVPTVGIQPTNKGTRCRADTLSRYSSPPEPSPNRVGRKLFVRVLWGNQHHDVLNQDHELRLSPPHCPSSLIGAGLRTGGQVSEPPQQPPTVLVVRPTDVPEVGVRCSASLGFSSAQNLTGGRDRGHGLGPASVER